MRPQTSQGRGTHASTLLGHARSTYKANRYLTMSYKPFNKSNLAAVILWHAFPEILIETWTKKKAFRGVVIFDSALALKKNEETLNSALYQFLLGTVSLIIATFLGLLYITEIKTNPGGYALLLVTFAILVNWAVEQVARLAVNHLSRSAKELKSFWQFVEEFSKRTQLSFDQLGTAKVADFRLHIDEMITSHAIRVRNVEEMEKNSLFPDTELARLKGQYLERLQICFDYFKSLGLVTEDTNGGYGWYFEEADRRLAAQAV